MSLRLCLFETFLDQVVVHKEETDADLMKDHVKSIAKRQRSLTCLAELTQCRFLCCIRAYGLHIKAR